MNALDLVGLTPGQRKGGRPDASPDPAPGEEGEAFALAIRDGAAQTPEGAVTEAAAALLPGAMPQPTMTATKAAIQTRPDGTLPGAALPAAAQAIVARTPAATPLGQAPDADGQGPRAATAISRAPGKPAPPPHVAGSLIPAEEVVPPRAMPATQPVRGAENPGAGPASPRAASAPLSANAPAPLTPGQEKADIRPAPRSVPTPEVAQTSVAEPRPAPDGQQAPPAAQVRARAMPDRPFADHVRAAPAETPTPVPDDTGRRPTAPQALDAAQIAPSPAREAHTAASRSPGSGTTFAEGAAPATPAPQLQAPVSPAPGAPAPPPLTAPDRSVLAQVAAAIPPGTAPGTIDVTLDPPELGRIDIVIELAEQTLRATLSADRTGTGELIRRHLDLLSEQFREAGFTDVDLTYSEPGGHGDGNHQEAGTATQLPGEESPIPGEMPAAARPAITAAHVDIRL